MKSLLIFLISFQCGAVTIAKYKSERDGSVSQSFEIEKSKTTYAKGSNLFDLEKNDLRVGQFSAKDPSSVQEIHQKLIELEKRFKIVDEELKKRKTSFNEVSGSPDHKTILILGSFRIMPESKYYNELNTLYKELQKKEWSFDEGFELTKDLSQVSIIKEGKVLRTEKYNKDFYCKESTLTCTYIGGGQIFVSKIN